jgi:hypothetical protein
MPPRAPIENGNEFKTKINLTRKDQKQKNEFYADFIFIMLIIRHSNPTIAGTSHKSGCFFSYHPTVGYTQKHRYVITV